MFSRTNHSTVPAKIVKDFFVPLLAPLVQNRRVTLLLAGIAVLQVSLTATGLPAWQCPFKSSVGLSCPGCGLSTAMALLLQNEWRAAIIVHPFAPVFLLGCALLLVVGLLPDRFYLKTVRRIAALERRTGLVPFLLISIGIYWVLRLSHELWNLGSA
jgi:hypothetical protein